MSQEFVKQGGSAPVAAEQIDLSVASIPRLNKPSGGVEILHNSHFQGSANGFESVDLRADSLAPSRGERASIGRESAYEAASVFDQLKGPALANTLQRAAERDAVDPEFAPALARAQQIKLRGPSDTIFDQLEGGVTLVVAERMRELGFDPKESPLVARNFALIAA